MSNFNLYADNFIGTDFVCRTLRYKWLVQKLNFTQIKLRRIEVFNSEKKGLNRRLIKLFYGSLYL